MSVSFSFQSVPQREGHVNKEQPMDQKRTHKIKVYLIFTRPTVHAKFNLKMGSRPTSPYSWED